MRLEIFWIVSMLSVGAACCCTLFTILRSLFSAAPELTMVTGIGMFAHPSTICVEPVTRAQTCRLIVPI